MDYLSDIGKCIIGATKDVYNAGVDASIIDGDRIGPKNVRRSLMFDDPPYGANDDDECYGRRRHYEWHEHHEEYIGELEYDDDSDPWRKGWLMDIRQITEEVGREIMRVQELGFLMREIFWDAKMEHVTILYENPENGRWLKSTLNYENFL